MMPNPHMAIRALALAVVTAAVLFGCGSSSGTGGTTSPAATSSPKVASPGPPQPVDACSLVTAADAQLVLGQDPGPPEPSHTQRAGVDIYQCAYAQGGTAHTVLATVKVPITRSAFDSERAIYAGHFTVQNVPGIGQEAYSYGQSSGGISVGDVTFLQGQYEVSIGGYVTGVAPTEIVARLTQVATHASSQLPA
jgi:hypothetical protein